MSTAPNLRLLHDSAIKNGPVTVFQHRPALTKMIVEGSTMAARPLPSAELLRQLLRYEPETGRLFWRARPESMFRNAGLAKRWNAEYEGREALTSPNGLGYFRGFIMGQRYVAHRVIWAIETGSFPTDEIDHINRNPSDNRIANLREAGRNQNSHNRGMQRNNTSGFKGVTWHKRLQKWQSSIRLNKKLRFLGYFDTPEAAHAAYCRASTELHGEYGRIA